MKAIFYTLIWVLGIACAHAEPYDSVFTAIAKCNTMTECRKVVDEFYSKFSYPIKLERKLDFGYQQIFYDFDYSYSTPLGSHYQEFHFYAIVKNDSIIFGRIEQIHWRGRVEKRMDFKRLEHELSQYVEMYNGFYKRE